MTTATTKGQFSLKCLDQRMVAPLILDRKKVMIGSEESCDLQIPDKSVCSVHAFILVNGHDGFTVKDLASESGTFVNGKKVNEAFVGPNDILTFGTVSFSVEALSEDEDVPMFNPDELVKPVELPQSIVEASPKKSNLIFIDGEYCDIIFDDSKFVPLTQLPEMEFKGNYVELDETIEALDIVHSTKAKRLEVISYTNGLMMDVSYVDLSDGEYHLTSEKKNKRDILFNTIRKTRIFSINNGELRFYPQEYLVPSIPWESVNLSEPLFLTFGAEQVSFRLVDKTNVWRGIPLFYRDREFYKQASKVFAGVFLPLLILLFITIPEKEAEKPDVAVVYKLPEKVKPPEKAPEAVEKTEVATAEPQKTQENTGHKETQQVPTKVEHAAASQKVKVVAKAAAPTPSKAVANDNRPAPQATPTPAPKPVKAYQFKSSIAFGSLVGDAPKIDAKGGGAASGAKDTAFNAGSSDSGALVAGANIGVSKFNNGADKSGSGSASFGSRGLASKAGFDSSYLEPKTVVLGSMDPELLRKILREYIPQFRHCYQQELIGHSEKIKGVIDLNFTISPTGKVTRHNISAKDARFSKKGINCMAQVLSIIDFPKPKGGGVVDVRQPLNFFAESEKI